MLCSARLTAFAQARQVVDIIVPFQATANSPRTACYTQLVMQNFHNQLSIRYRTIEFCQIAIEVALNKGLRFKMSRSARIEAVGQTIRQKLMQT